MMRKFLFLVGFVCLGIYAAATVQSWWHQKQLENEFEQQMYKPAPMEKTASAVRKLKEGELVGRLEIPKLDVSVMVMEGIGSRTLRLGAGRIPGTATPWTTGNMGIAAHRDTFFRPLGDLQKDDTITFTTVDGTREYKVTSTQIVKPEDTHVLKPTGKDTITLVTCYPFYYVGPAPQRFIVQATAN